MPTNNKLLSILKQGGIAVLPTDTQYGLITLALNQKSVEKVYQLRKRSPDKPFIILISSINDLALFKITIDKTITNYLNDIWPNPISVILPCPQNGFYYLHRGTKSLAFRIPNNQDLLEILKETGPLIAPSANLEGYPYAKNISEAKEYFKDNIDFYIDKGRLESNPSTLIKIEEGKIIILRQGQFQISSLPKNLP